MSIRNNFSPCQIPSSSRTLRSKSVTWVDTAEAASTEMEASTDRESKKRKSPSPVESDDEEDTKQVHIINPYISPS